MGVQLYDIDNQLWGVGLVYVAYDMSMILYRVNDLSSGRRLPESTWTTDGEILDNVFFVDFYGRYSYDVISIDDHVDVYEDTSSVCTVAKFREYTDPVFETEC